MQYLEGLHPVRVSDILMSVSPSFRTMILQLGDNGRPVALSIMVKLINDLLDFFNIGKTMDQGQVTSTVNLLLDDYSQLKPDDFMLCFNRAKKGTYGKVYDRIDGQIIFEWVEKYIQERDSEIEGLRQSENNRLKKESALPLVCEKANTEGDAVPMPDWFVIPSKKPAYDASRPVERKEDPVQQMFNGFMSQFDRIHKNRPHPLKGGRFIRRYGRVMNIEDYIAYKDLQVRKVRAYLSKKQ